MCEGFISGKLPLTTNSGCIFVGYTIGAVVHIIATYIRTMMVIYIIIVPFHIGGFGGQVGNLLAPQICLCERYYYKGTEISFTETLTNFLLFYAL